MNESKTTPLGHRVLWVFLVLVLAGVLAVPALADTTYDLRTPGSVAVVNGAIFMQFTPDGTEPAASFAPFLSMDVVTILASSSMPPRAKGTT